VAALARLIGETKLLPGWPDEPRARLYGYVFGLTLGVAPILITDIGKESTRRARDSRASPVEGGADGCDARALSA